MSFFYDDFELGSVAPRGLKPGELWPGPHAGIAYRLSAGGSDIYFEHEERPRRFTKHLLSDYAAQADIRRLVQRLVPHKGTAGGRIYINEAREFFTPLVADDGGVEYVYLGPLRPDDVWFPAPRVPFS